MTRLSIEPRPPAPRADAIHAISTVLRGGRTRLGVWKIRIDQATYNMEYVAENSAEGTPRPWAECISIHKSDTNHANRIIPKWTWVNSRVGPERSLA